MTTPLRVSRARAWMTIWDVSSPWRSQMSLGWSPRTLFRGQTEKAGHFLQPATIAMGQNLLNPPSVAGWAGGKAWITPGLLIARGNEVGAADARGQARTLVLRGGDMSDEREGWLEEAAEDIFEIRTVLVG